MITVEVRINDYTSDGTLVHISKELLKCGIESSVKQVGLMKRYLEVKVPSDMSREDLIALGVLIGKMEGTRINS